MQGSRGRDTHHPLGLTRRVLGATAAALLAVGVLTAQRSDGPSQSSVSPAPEVGRVEAAGVSPPASELQDALPVTIVGAPGTVVETPRSTDFASGQSAAVKDTAVQLVAPLPNMPSPGGTPAPFDGLNSQDNANNYAGTRFNPPNVSGDVGISHYVQVVNSLVRVYDKATSTPSAAAFKMASLFTGLTGNQICSNNGNNYFDALVLYDQLSDRWLLTQSAYTSPIAGTYFQCVALSTSPDPTGTYNVFRFQLPGTYQPRSAKFGVWPDGYYMAYNQHTNGAAYSGVRALAFDRAKMLSTSQAVRDQASFVSFNLGAFFTIGTTAIGGMLPADFEGPVASQPAAGTPNYFAMLGVRLNYFNTGGATDTVRLFDFHADFTTTSNSTFIERPESPVPVAPYDVRNPAPANPANDIEQPAPAAASSYLDSGQDRLQHRLVYRNFTAAIPGPGGANIAAHDSLVVTHTVNVGADPATAAGHQSAIRYYEFRRTGSTNPFGVAEQATFAPDTDNRWMGSAAMDSQGNIAIGYSVSSLSTFPSIRYAGRLATDPVNGLYQGESEIVAGTGVQLDTGGRWGDYSQLSLDLDGCTFWYAAQYYTAASQVSSNLGWLTRIANFKFPGCSGTAGTISGTVRDASTNSPIANARVTFAPGGAIAYTDASGLYTQSLAFGTYTVTASATNYGTVANPGVLVNNTTPVTSDFLLPVAPQITTQPANQIVNAGDNATFTFAAIGSPTPTLQWQVSTDGGTTFNDLTDNATYGGTTTGTLAITNVTAGLNNNQYRGRATNSVGTVDSSAATLTLTVAPAITTQPTSLTIAVNTSTFFTVAASGNPPPGLQWQVSTDGGVTFTNLANSAPYSGVTTPTLNVTSAPFTLHLRQYRAVATNSAGSATSNAATLTFTGGPSFTTQPTNQSAAVGQNTSFTAIATGNATITYQWQVSTDGGASFTNLTEVAPYSGVQTTTLTVTNVTAGLAGNLYRSIATNSVASAASNAASLTLTATPTFTTQPTNQTIVSGGNGSLTVVASGSPAPTLQWQVSTNAGASWTDLANNATYGGVTTATLTLTGVTSGLNGNQYRAVGTNSAGTTNSNAATLTVSVAPAITTQPTNQTVGSGGSASFTVAASGNPTPSFQWQLSTDGGTTFNNVTNNATYSGATTATLTITSATTALNSNRYRALATNSAGSATSNAATLTVTDAPVITTQPSNASVALGGNTSFTAAASGTPAPTLQWEVSTGGGAFGNVSDGGVYSGATTGTLTITGVTEGLNGNQYRMKATNTSGTTTSNAASLTVTGFPQITTQPVDTSVAEGTPATFTVAASGAATLLYRWQQSTDGGTVWNNLSDVAPFSGVTTTALTVASVTVGLSGSKYRCVVTNGLGSATSNAATLTITSPPAITSNPTDLTIAAGANGSFTVAASGSPAPTFQWRVSTDGGTTFDNVSNTAPYSGATTATLTVTNATAGLNGNQYRAVATNSDGVTTFTATSTAAILTVTQPAAITTQPTDQTVNAGSNAVFTVVASGNPAPTYQWQQSLNGGSTWANLSNNATFSGVTTNTLTVASVIVDWNGQQYRVLVSNSTGAATSNAAVLNVTVPAAITTHPTSVTQAAATNATFTVAATGTPAPTYRWQLSTNGGTSYTDLIEQAPYSGVTGPTLTVTNILVGMSGNLYRCKVENTVAGPTVITVFSNAATLTVTAAPAITTQPSDQLDVTVGNNVQFIVAASGSPAPTFQWQVSVNNGATFANLANDANHSGAGTATLTVTAAAGLHLNRYRAVATNSTGTATSSAALLTIAGAPTITTQPTGQTIFAGAGTSFSVVAAGNATLTYQWQVQTGAYTFTTPAGLAGTSGSTDGTGGAARFNSPFSIAFGSGGVAFVADFGNHTIRQVTPAGVVTTFAGLAGNLGSADGTGATARFSSPGGVAVGIDGTVYVADTGNQTIRKITPAGVVTTLAGQAGSAGFADGTGSAARFSSPWGLDVDSAGNVYVADFGNNRIRMITPAGVVTTLAGQATAGSADGTGAAAQFSGPVDVAVDAAGTLYVTDFANATVRKVTAAGVVTTLAGLAGTTGSADGLGGAARFNNPIGIAVDGFGRVYVSDRGNRTFRRITAAGLVTTIGGQVGVTGSADGVGTAATFNNAWGVAVNPGGTVLAITDSGNHTIRQGALWTDLANVAPYSGVTTDTLLITSATTALDRLIYRSIVANSIASATSAAAGLRVFSAPAITTNPSSQTVVAGANASFTVAASGNPTPGFQWQVSTDNGVSWTDLTNVAPYSGVTATTLTVTNVTIALHTFQYRAVASNLAGSATSTAATLTVTGAPTVTAPASQTIGAGTTTSFFSSASGSPVPTVQWQSRPSTGSWTNLSNVAPYSGVTTTTLTITNATASLNGRQYRMVATNAVGTATSVPATLVVTGATLSGHVYITGTTTGIANALVSVYPGGLTAATDATGFYSVVVPSGTITVTALAPGYLASSIASFSVPCCVITTRDIELTSVGAAAAAYDATLKAPKCASTSSGCDSGALLVGRDTIADNIGPPVFPGPEPNQPNTILNSCQDGQVGLVHADESIDRVVVSTLDGTPMQAGKIVRIDVTVWVWIATSNFLDLYYASNANSPAWTYLTTLAMPAGSNFSLQTLSATYVLPTGALQAVRASFRELNNPSVSPSTCTTGGYDERDDLIFTVGAAAPTSGAFSTLAGQAGAAGHTDGPGSVARFSQPRAVAVDSNGNTYVADTYNHVIRKITPGGVVSTFAGMPGVSGPTAPGGSADGTGSTARFNLPYGIAVDSAGNVYVGDSYNHLVRKITPAGVVTTLAGSALNQGTADGTGSVARFTYPGGLGVDSAGNVFVADINNHTIRKITPAGVVSTFAGLAGTSGIIDATGNAARFYFPWAAVVDSADNVYVADRSNNRIRKITPAGVVSTLAGQTTPGSADGTGAAAQFSAPEGVAVDSAGTVYVADTVNHTIRKITSAGVVTTLAGAAGTLGSADGVGSVARFNSPGGVGVDTAGKVYVADTGNSTIRRGSP